MSMEVIGDTCMSEDRENQGGVSLSLPGAGAGNAKPPSMVAWLDVLRAVLPPRGVLLVGAGSGKGPWVQWLLSRNVASDGVSVHMVEGDERQYRHLQRSVGDNNGWTLWRDVVVPSAGATTFHRLSNPDESGLLAAQNLRKLWPNLSDESSAAIKDATTLDALGEEAGGDANWLILDCLPATALLQGGTELLRKLDVVLVRVADDLPPGLLADQHAVDQLLCDAGLRAVCRQVERHPALAHVLYVRDVRRHKIEHGDGKDLQSDARIRGAADPLQMLQAGVEPESLHAEGGSVQPHYLFESPLRLDSGVMNIGFNPKQPEWVCMKDGVIHYETKDDKPLYIVSKEDGNYDVSPEAGSFRISPDTDFILRGHIGRESGGRPNVWVYQYDSNKRIDGKYIPIDDDGRFSLEFRTKTDARACAIGLRLSGSGSILPHATSFRLLEKALGMELVETRLADMERRNQLRLDNAIRQIESFIRLQNYMGADILVPDIHNWAISPDFGVLLIQLVEQNAYDAVIEFGSGTSTLILARALQKVALRTGFASAPLLSFDHLEQFQRQSQDYLVRAGLADNASVVFAPLHSWHADETPYYSCEDALWQFRGRLTKALPRILVVVDGPPGTIGLFARHPALPRLLNGLGDSCHFDFLMDDYGRKDERETLVSWECSLSQMGRKFIRREYGQLEKQACLLEVFPAQAGAPKGKGAKKSGVITKRVGAKMVRKDV